MTDEMSLQKLRSPGGSFAFYYTGPSECASYCTGIYQLMQYRFGYTGRYLYVPSRYQNVLPVYSLLENRT
jgi:hypothetical protein